MSTPTDVWVAVPVLNHDDNFRSLLEDILNHCSNVVVIDDGSWSGNIGECIKGLKVDLIQHEKNLGKGVALLSAAKHIKAKNGKTMITIDADGQHVPSDIDLFVTAIKEKPDHLRIGTRDLSGENVPPRSRIGNRLSSWLIYLETGVWVEDSQSGFRAYPISVFDKVEAESTRFGIETELLVRALWQNIPVHAFQIQIHYPAPEKRVSHYLPVLDTLRIASLHVFLLVEGFFHFQTEPATAEEKREEEKPKPPSKLWRYCLIIGLYAFFTALVAAVGVDWIRRHGDEYFLNKIEQPKPPENAEQKWLKSLDSKRPVRALYIAQQFRPEEELQLPRVDYMQIVRQNGLTVSFLTCPVSEWDAKYWQNCRRLQLLAGELTKDSKTPCLSLLRAVCQRVTPPAKGAKPTIPALPYDVWRFKAGGFSERVYLLAALAEQLGWSTRIVVFVDEQGKPQRSLVELEKDNAYFTADLFSGRAWPCSVAVLAQKPPTDLPQSYAAMLKNRRAYMQVFCPFAMRRYNQLLGSYISEYSVPPRYPVIGFPPHQELDDYVAAHPEYDKTKCRFMYWTYPLQAMSKRTDLPHLWFPREKYVPPQVKTDSPAKQ